MTAPNTVLLKVHPCVLSTTAPLRREEIVSVVQALVPVPEHDTLFGAYTDAGFHLRIAIPDLFNHTMARIVRRCLIKALSSREGLGWLVFVEEVIMRSVSSWSYWPLYTGSNIQPGSTFSIRSQLNDVRYDDTMFATNYQQFYEGGHSWSGSPIISHNGTVTVNRGLNSNIGYIGIVIYYEPIANSHNETIEHFIKGINLNIPTPMQTQTSATLSSSTSATLAATSGSSTPSQDSEQPTVSIATKVGAAIGSIALVVLLVIAFILYRGQKKKTSTRHLEERDTSQISYQYDTLGRPPNEVPLVNRPFFIPSDPTNPVPSTRPTSPPSMTSTRPHDVPPLYRASSQSNALYVVPPTSFALTTFADANRDLISEDLEGRLSAAGYLPSDDPDNLTEEEWMTLHNVTKLEVMRLRSLFAARTRRTETVTTNAGVNRTQYPGETKELLSETRRQSSEIYSAAVQRP
ncbi:hypothetical protein M408DRAFT_9985 [Serendipita vermifera MAFF 305830]|uniref:Uncharacterized protein n=1 Tax=Serendipita vermifera MAFF 305830 TaxID=933852 RepID=A0A0C3B1R7_SERVB|nr:hypothetical protein M408DRAFT_9985 [Serendipita vermifera MAFF 305830]